MAYPYEAGGPDDYPVRPGLMMMSLVDATPGFERAYHRWYERDHFYAGAMEGAYTLAGARWIATRELKDLRWPRTEVIAEPWDAGSFLGTYFVLEGKFPEWQEWAVRRVRELYAEGRGFAERTHVHSKNYDVLGADYRDEDPVPLALALDRRFPGIVVLWSEGPEGTDAVDTLTALREKLLPELLAGSSIEVVANLVTEANSQGESPKDLPMPLGSGGGGPNRLCQVFFVNGDVREAVPAVRAYGEAMEAAGIAQVRFGAPFVPTVPGTDTHLDRL